MGNFEYTCLKYSFIQSEIRSVNAIFSKKLDHLFLGRPVRPLLLLLDVLAVQPLLDLPTVLCSKTLCSGPVLKKK